MFVKPITNPEARYMKRALELAALGTGHTRPNPMVGAVVVAGGRIVGTGWHRCAGTPHAEVHALSAAGARAHGATLYTTLEPCNHVGRTGKCTDAIIAAGVKRVVAAMIDPSPLVRGAGVRRLRRAGIEVEVGLLGDAANALLDAYAHHATSGRPLVTLKVALTLDGRIATRTGDSKWVTSDEARERARQMRVENDAVLVGIETVLADDPALTPCIEGARAPVRIIVDSRLRTPPTAKLFTADGGGPVVIVAAKGHSPRGKRRLALERLATIIDLPSDVHGIRIDALLEALGALDIQSLLVEGGSRIHGSFIRERAAQRLVAFIAPCLLADPEAVPFAAAGARGSMADAIQVAAMSYEEVGGALMLTGRFEWGADKPRRRAKAT